MWCKTGCRGGRERGTQGRAGAQAAGTSNPNRTYWKGVRLGAPFPPSGYPSHASLSSSPKYSPRQEQTTPGKNDPGGDGTGRTRGPAMITAGRHGAVPMVSGTNTPPKRGQGAVPYRLMWRLNLVSSSGRLRLPRKHSFNTWRDPHRSAVFPIEDTLNLPNPEGRRDPSCRFLVSRARAHGRFSVDRSHHTISPTKLGPSFPTVK